jgi:hypothetical protein
MQAPYQLNALGSRILLGHACIEKRKARPRSVVRLLANQQLVANIEPILMVPSCIAVVLDGVRSGLFALHWRSISH